jgi:hypothetical protein
MPYRRGYGERRAPLEAADPDDADAFRLVTIRPAATPEGCMGRDWLVYRISQGRNVITGYRRGDLQTATADVERIVVGLNERRAASKSRPGPKPKTTAASAAEAAPAAPADAEDGKES